MKIVKEKGRFWTDEILRPVKPDEKLPGV